MEKKLAIVGMDACFGSCNGLDNFERIIYEGTQHSISVPSQENNLHSANQKQSFWLKEDHLNSKLFPEIELSSQIGELHLEELLMLKIAEGALRDARIKKNKNIAVIFITEEPDAIKSQLNKNSNLEERENKISISKRLSELGNFAGYSLTLNARKSSVFKAIEIAQKLLIGEEVEAVLIGAVDLSNNLEKNLNKSVKTLSYDKNANGCIIGEGSGAVVLKLYESAQKNSDRIYAIIDAISLLEKEASSTQGNNATKFPNDEAVKKVCQTAVNLANINLNKIGYLEVFASGITQEDESEIKGLTQAYRNSGKSLSCAIGSIKTNIGHTNAASGIDSLIKTALCLYHRYIPATPNWTSPKMAEIWQGTPFYVPTESKPWFLEPGETKRIAAINGIGLDKTYAHLILSEEVSQKERSSNYLEKMPFYLFPIAANDCSTLLDKLQELQQKINNIDSLFAAANQTFIAYQKHCQTCSYAVAVVGRNKDELAQEIERTINGVSNAFKNQKEWKTPVGSYFTPNPLGKTNEIAYVYPGAYSSYIGLARNLFHLFPKLYDNPAINSVCDLVANIEKFLYPRSLNSLTVKQLAKLEQRFLEDALAMLESEMGIATLIAAIMRDYFQIQPKYNFGYSLGETSMLFAQGVWTNFKECSNILHSSPLFSTRLSGPKNAIREYWQLPQQQKEESEDLWSNYVVLASPSEIKERLQQENRVYLTQINTDKEVVIAGDPKACEQVVKDLNCDAFRAPFNHAIHCEPIKSEYEELVKINTLPIKTLPKTTFYSAEDYLPMAIDSQIMGKKIGKMLCQQLDFPRLINQVYNDGARIFIEAGVGSNCSRWIKQTLSGKEHFTASLNKRGVDDHTSIVRLLAQLLSHRVSFDLSPLYSLPKKSSQSTFTGSKNAEINNFSYPNTVQLQTLIQSSNRLTKAHATFLRSRHQSLQIMSEIIQMQLALSQKVNGQ